MNEWIPNPEWQKLPEPEVGCIVHLRVDDAFQYILKVIVESVQEDIVSGRIEALFDVENDGQVDGGNKWLGLVGKEADFARHYMHKVILKPAPTNPTTD